EQDDSFRVQPHMAGRQLVQVAGARLCFHLNSIYAVNRGPSAVSLRYFFRRQIKCHRLVLEAVRLVRPVAKRLVGRMPAAAKRDDGAALKPVGVALCVEDFELPVQFDGAVVVDGDFFLLRKSVFLTLMDAVLKRSMLAFGLPTP
ncbi:MAG: hypothetical protein MUC59_11515, partial [Saprospiraceae bacterium]|nr:hypothetical protein [Saprospiraceae bacterium]